MSLTTDHTDIVFQCDTPGCGAVLETGTSNFETARNVLRRNRWQPYKAVNDSAGDWMHRCAECCAPLLRRP